MNRDARVWTSFACFVVLSFAAYFLTKRGVYGFALFLMLPFIAGGLGTWSFRPATVRQAMKIGAAIGAAGCGLFLVLGIEGLICVAMAIPILIPFAITGSVLAYWARIWSNPKRPAVLGLLVPLTLFFDVNATPPVYSVTTKIVVNAAPERVWKYVVAFPGIQAQPDWLLRTGVAYPIRTRIVGSGAGAARKCDLSTGTVEERVVVWDEPRLLRFEVTATPPAMKETGLYGEINANHLNGYYIAKQGEFCLTPLTDGRTLVVGTSWYQHGLWPAEYWRWWSDAVVHHVHRRVLEHIRQLSEGNYTG